MDAADPFEGLGKALAHLRVRAGFARQTEVSEALGFDRGQLSRWEHDTPRPSLENLGRLLVGYGATVQDLAAALGSVTEAKVERSPSDEELIRSLTEAIRRVEGRQSETESRLERLEQDLGRSTA